MRKKDYWINNLVKPYWDHYEEPLGNEERKRAKKDDFLFIGEEEKKFKEWCDNYKKAKNKYYKPKAGEAFKNGKELSSYPAPVFFPGFEYNDYEKYSITTPPPFPPENNYLLCWKQQWNEKSSPNLINKRDGLKVKACQYYYPYSKKEDKSLKACDEERKEKEDKENFTKSVILYPLIISLFVGIASGIGVYKFQVWDAENKNKSKQMQQKQVDVSAKKPVLQEAKEKNLKTELKNPSP